MRYATLLSAAVVAGTLIVVGCSNSPQSSGGDGTTPMPANGAAVEGNPGATTGPSVGYDRSDPTHYHPLTDDKPQARPANADTIRQQSGQ